MNDILIGAIIIIICVSVFILMSVLVVDSHNENKKMEEFNMKFNMKDHSDDMTITECLDQWNELIVQQKENDKPDEIIQLKEMLKQVKMDLSTAIADEEYEVATQLRDQIQNLKLELKKFSDEDQIN